MTRSFHKSERPTLSCNIHNYQNQSLFYQREEKTPTTHQMSLGICYLHRIQTTEIPGRQMTTISKKPEQRGSVGRVPSCWRRFFLQHQHSHRICVQCLAKHAEARTGESEVTAHYDDNVIISRDVCVSQLYPSLLSYHRYPHDFSKSIKFLYRNLYRKIVFVRNKKSNNIVCLKICLCITISTLI